MRVNTGPLQFEVTRLGPWLDTPGLRDVDVLLRSDERIYRASRWPATASQAVTVVAASAVPAPSTKAMNKTNIPVDNRACFMFLLLWWIVPARIAQAFRQ